jgi:hypothetical protein
MTDRDGTHEEAVIDKVFYGTEDHGILTCCLYLRFGTGGSGQGFGNLVLDAKTGLDFKQSLSEFFGKPFDAIVGSKCFALRCWGDLQDHIVGLELPNGKRFTLYAWCKKHWPDKTLTPLEARRESTRKEIAWLKRRLVEERERLEKVAEGYVDWERKVRP